MTIRIETHSESLEEMCHSAIAAATNTNEECTFVYCGVELRARAGDTVLQLGLQQQGQPVCVGHPRVGARTPVPGPDDAGGESRGPRRTTGGPRWPLES